MLLSLCQNTTETYLEIQEDNRKTQDRKEEICTKMKPLLSCEITERNGGVGCRVKGGLLLRFPCTKRWTRTPEGGGGPQRSHRKDSEQVVDVN